MNIRIDESELLAYVEGALAPADRARVEAALAQSAGLQASAHAMQRDRALLRELGRTAAPRGLVEEAVARAEREALLGAGSLQCAPAKRSVWKLAPVRVALAAGLGLAITGALLAPSYFAKTASPPGPVADAAPAEAAPVNPEPGLKTASAGAEAPNAHEPALAPQAPVIAVAPPVDPARGSLIETLDPSHIVGPTPVSIDVERSVANAVTLTPAHAAAYLKTGRLELRVVAKRPDRVAARVEDLAVGAASDLMLLDSEGKPVRSVLNSGASRPAIESDGYVFEAFGVPTDAAWLEHAREWLSVWGGVQSAEFAPAEAPTDNSQPGTRMIIRITPPAL